MRHCLGLPDADPAGLLQASCSPSVSHQGPPRLGEPWWAPGQQDSWGHWAPGPPAVSGPPPSQPPSPSGTPHSPRCTAGSLGPALPSPQARGQACGSVWTSASPSAEGEDPFYTGLLGCQGQECESTWKVGKFHAGVMEKGYPLGSRSRAQCGGCPGGCRPLPPGPILLGLLPSSSGA